MTRFWGLLLVVVGGLLLPRPTYSQQSALTDDPEILAIIERLEATPFFLNITTDAVYEIFEHGQQLGNRADVFTMVGDSNTTNGDFMRPIGLERNYCEYGDYEELQETVAYFSAVEPREGQRNSFTNESAAAAKGFGTAHLLDPFWAEPSLCERNESPLMCEYRLTRPSVAIIMLGQIDINYGGPATPEQYRANMEQIIQQSIDQGVIPVLTTIVFLPERDVWPLSMRYNDVLLDLAETYQIPLINLWRAVQPLPDYGIGPDRSHLKARVGDFCSFNGPEQELGGTLRNLLTLQMLDELRRTVLTGQQPAS